MPEKTTGSAGILPALGGILPVRSKSKKPNGARRFLLPRKRQDLTAGPAMESMCREIENVFHSSMGH